MSKLRLMRLLLAQRTATICSIGHNHMRSEQKMMTKNDKQRKKREKEEEMNNYVDDSMACNEQHNCR